MITVDKKNPAYPVAIQQLKDEQRMPEGIQMRQVKYLNNIVEQDHRCIKKRVRYMLGFKTYETATSIVRGIESMHMMKKRASSPRDEVCPKSKKNSLINCLALYHNP
ncbi:hypothetical protein GCM10020331_007300 [Ectobacillus funiculus]